MTIWALIPLITCLAYIGLLIPTLASIKKRANKLFAIYVSSAAIWSFTSFILHLNSFPQQALLWNQLLTIAIVWVLITYYHFIRAYTNKPAGIGVYLGYLTVLVLAILSLSDQIVQYAYVENGVLHSSLGNSIYFIGTISLAFATAVVVQLIKQYRSSIDPTDRDRTTYLLTGWSIVTLSAYSNLIPALAKFPLDHIGSLINALIITYIISKFRLIDSKLVLQKVVLYLSLTVFLIALYLRLMLFIIASLPVMGGYNILLPSAAFAILVALLFNPLRDLLQGWIDRVLYSTASGPRRMLLNFSNNMGNIIELDQLADAILPAITKILHITQAKLLFEDTNTGEFITQFTYPETKDKLNNELRFNPDNPIIIWLAKETGPLNLNDIDNIPQLKGLWQSERKKLIDSNIEFLYPIKSRGKKLIGILALDKKKSGTLYTHGDIELVINIVGQAGTLMENARLYRQAVVWAHTDGLTKLYNHRYFHERMSEEIARGSRSGAAFSVMMMDIDNFKLYNDTYGHLAGDKILRNLGETLLRTIRDMDMAFRYGGEEFAIILPGTQLGDAYKVTERIRKLITEKTKSDKGSITVSLGISSWPNDGIEKEEVIARADAALYQAKRTGGNRTCTSAEIPHVSVEHETGSKALSIAYALAATADAKDHRTYGHSRKVSQYATAICEALNMPQDRIASIRAAALLHDIGKISIPDAILNKAGPLTPKESDPVKAHPWLGVEILKHVVDLDSCLPAILHHHEHYDGNGYPSGLKGENIPLEGRILSIADAYDAMTSLRSYREQLPSQQALDELRRCSGTQFDPELVNIFCGIIEQTLQKETQTT